MHELVARTLGNSPPERELADRISALACGNPLFAEEIALSLRTEGLIAIVTVAGVRSALWMNFDISGVSSNHTRADRSR